MRQKGWGGGRGSGGFDRAVNIQCHAGGQYTIPCRPCTQERHTVFLFVVAVAVAVAVLVVVPTCVFGGHF